MSKVFENILKELPKLEVYLESMQNCIQEPKYHGEKDVLKHTELVCEYADILSKNLNERDRKIILYAATLHDAGKPKCTSEENGEIIHRGHSKLSYHIALEILHDIKLPFIDLLQILNLIRNHGNPNYTIENSNEEYDVIKMSLDCRLDLLYMLATADNLGRISDNNDELMIKLEYFKEVAERLNCFNNPYQFKSDTAKFNYLIKKTHYHTDIPYEKHKCTARILCGIAGSGKDYLIQKMNWNSDTIISLDDIRKEFKVKQTDDQGTIKQIAKERLKECLRKGKDFTWNSTNSREQFRSELVSICSDYGAFIEIHYIHKPLQKIIEQNRTRDEKEQVNIKIIENMQRKLEIPMQYEAHKVIYHF